MKYYVKGKKEKYLVKKDGVIGKVNNIRMATSFGSETKARKCLEEGRKQGLGLKNWKVEEIDRFSGRIARFPFKYNPC